MTTIGINTYAYAWTQPAAETIRRLSDLGYRAFELLVHPPHLPIEDFTPAQRREVASLLAKLSPELCSLNLPSLDHNMASAWTRVRRASIAMFEDTIDLAADLGIPWLVTVPGRISALSPASMEDRTRWMSDCIEALLPRAERRGVGLAIENVPFASFPDAASLGTFVRSFGSSSVAACYDVANAHYLREDPAQGIRDLADQLRIVHVSDTPQDVWKHDPVGTGTVPFGEVAEAIAEIGFGGPTMLEVVDPNPEAAIISSHDRLAKAGFPARAA